MKQKTFYSFMLASVITLATGLLVSCEKDLCKDNPSESNSYITFSEPEIENMISTRTLSTVNEAANPAIVERATLRSEKGDSMRLRVTEEDFFTMRGEKADKTLTRGSLVTSASGITTFGVSCSVYPSAGTYTSYGCGAYFYKESATANTPTSYFWPTSDYKVSFFAYYPYNNAAFTVSSSAATTGSPVYAYTVPSTNANQVDVMTAQVTDHLAGSQGTLALTFSHNCAAIKINITNDSGDAITVNSVAIEGVEYSGTLHDGTWTLSGNLNSSSTNPFSLSYGSAIADGATADITGSSNIFIMLPQTLTSSAKLKIVTSDDTFETTISGSWMAGKTYTYSITKEADGAIDLSMVDNAGNERASMTTANCYLVHAAGKYKIPLVYGNAIKNGTDNRIAYYPGENGSITNGTDLFVNHNGDGITGPWITKSGTGVDAGMNITVDGAELLWQDASGLISAVGIDGDYLTFTVPSDASTKAGNALIAVKSGSTIVWSWHIWVTTETLASTTTISTGNHDYAVASVNLGWVPTAANRYWGYCPFYQWGRKDAFIPASGYASNCTVYNINNNTIVGLTCQEDDSATIADHIKNPTVHYYNSSNYSSRNTAYTNMWDAQNSSIDNITSATKKTIYDPCPPEFCVPTDNLYYYMGNAANSSNGRYDRAWAQNFGKVWPLDGNNIFFPACGMRVYRSGDPNYASSSGYYWSSSPSNDYRGRSLYIDSSYWKWSKSVESAGNTIRPVAEE